MGDGVGFHEGDSGVDILSRSRLCSIVYAVLPPVKLIG